MKKIIIIIFVIVAALVIYVSLDKKEVAPVVVTPAISEKLCFYSKTAAYGNLYDVAWADMEINGDSVMGEIRNLPAEKDSKVGTFTGTLRSEQDTSGYHTIDAWWDSLAEGMRMTEELKIMLSDENVKIGFAEMVDRGDGTYVYKDAGSIGYWQSIDSVPCESLDERLLVEQYIRDNIATLVPENAVLGGTWYVTSINLDEQTKTGIMTYEDGHIMGSATFSYDQDGGVVVISNIQKQEVGE